jgi:uncharacterized protein (DUF302 family)
MKKVLLVLMMLILSVPVISHSQLAQKDYENDPQLQKTAIGFSLIVDLTFDEALSKVKGELKKEGFGILTEVDVKATMKKKLDLDIRPYQILGACNPPLAHKALEAEPQIGLMLPCKFVVYVNEDDKTVISAVDPVKMMEGIENEQLSEVAKSVQEKFIKVIASI